MKKSEKILIYCVAIAALYGAIDYSLKAFSTKPEVGLQITTSNIQLEELSNKLSARSKEANLVFAPLTEEIQKAWLKDVFLHQKPSAAPLSTIDQDDQADEFTEQLNEQARKLNYSGFLIMKDTKIAIIEGLDYREKELVNGFLITNITKDAIQLKKSGISFTILAKRESTTGKFSNTQHAPKELEMNKAFLTPKSIILDN